MSINIIGNKVTIKQNNEWGIIQSFDGNGYEVAMFGDTNDNAYLYRDEFTVHRTQLPVPQLYDTQGGNTRCSACGAVECDIHINQERNY